MSSASAALRAEPFGERIGVVEQRRHDLAKPPLANRAPDRHRRRARIATVAQPIGAAASRRRFDLRFAPPDRRRAHLFRPLPEKRDHVGAVLRAVEMEEHLDARHEGLRVGQPLVERLLVPDDIGGFQRVGIAVVGQRAGLAAKDAAMARSDVVLVERMAVRAGLVELLAARGVAGEAAAVAALAARQRRQPDSVANFSSST